MVWRKGGNMIPSFVKEREENGEGFDLYFAGTQCKECEEWLIEHKGNRLQSKKDSSYTMYQSLPIDMASDQHMLLELQIKNYTLTSRILESS